MTFDEYETHRYSSGEVTINCVHGGNGPPLLLLHGYPQTHVMWHAVAPHLASTFHVVCADLRATATAASRKEPQMKRLTTQPIPSVQWRPTWQASWHRSAIRNSPLLGDRGARVTHRLALDHPAAVTRAAVLDIAPTLHMFEATDQNFATAYYHWFFLIQPNGLPERMIGADPEWYLREKLKRWSAPAACFDPAAIAEYVRCFSEPDAIHASCEDYRGAATIDLVHDRADRANGHKVTCPLLVLWGAHGLVGRTYDMLDVWHRYARDVSGRALDCGHFLPEERPADVATELERFFAPASPQNSHHDIIT